MGRLDDIDFDHLNGWLGRTETATDIVTPGLVERYRATFGDWLADTPEEVPLGLHWCLAPAAVPRGELGPDGHPKRGGFLPPVPLENRMWAGGEIEFLAPLGVGETVERHSRVASITPKDGRSGPLVFVAVEHEHRSDGRLCVRERQDIVYRPASARPKAKVDGAVPEGAFVGDSVTLFRYSAMTFNGHRIHYDQPYVTAEEGYADLVVHGPMQATLLIHEAARRRGSTAIKVAYRGLAPLVAGEPATIAAPDADRVHLEKTDGTVTFEARHAASGGTV